MAINALVKIANDVFVNFYEVASIETDDGDVENTLIVLKSGHKVVIEGATPAEVSRAITNHLNGSRAQKQRGITYNHREYDND